MNDSEISARTLKLEITDREANIAEVEVIVSQSVTLARTLLESNVLKSCFWQVEFPLLNSTPGAGWLYIDFDIQRFPH